MSQPDISAIILPEVYTSLMEPINEDYPEALLQIGDRILIDIMIDNLIQSNVKQIIVVTKQHANRISEHLKPFKPFADVKVFSLPQMSQIEALKYIFEKEAQKFSNQPFVLISSPIVTNLNLLKLRPEQYQYQSEDQPLATMVMQQISETSILRQCDAPYFTLLSDDNLLQKFQPLGTNASQVQELNFALFKRTKSCRLSTNLQPCNIYLCGETFKQLVEQQQTPNLTVIDMVVQYVDQQQADAKKFEVYIERQAELSGVIDCPRTYRAVCRAYLKRYFYPYIPDNQLRMQHKAAVIGQNVTFGPLSNVTNFCIVGPGSYINGSVQGTQIGQQGNVREGAEIVDSVLMDNVTVGSGCRISQCVLMNACWIEGDVVLPPGSIVGPQCEVGPALVQHAIRCYLAHLWDREALRAQFPSEVDRQYLERFLEDGIPMAEEYVLRMPPVFIMRQELKTADAANWNEIRGLRSGLDAGQPFKYLRYPLYALSPSTVKPTKDADAEPSRSSSDADADPPFRDDYYGQEEEAYEVCEDEDVDSDDSGRGDAAEVTFESGSRGTSFDTTAPSNLAKEMVMIIQTETMDCYWVPNYVIAKAKALRAKASEAAGYATDLDLKDAVEQETRRWFTELVSECGYQARCQGQRRKLMGAVYSRPSVAGATKQVLEMNGVPVLAVGVKARPPTLAAIMYGQLRNVRYAPEFDSGAPFAASTVKTIKDNIQNSITPLLGDADSASQLMERAYRACMATVLQLALGLDAPAPEADGQCVLAADVLDPGAAGGARTFERYLDFLGAGDGAGPRTTWLYAPGLEDELDAADTLFLNLFELFRPLGARRVVNDFYAAVARAGLLSAAAAAEWRAGVLALGAEDLDDIMAYTQRVFRCADGEGAGPEGEGSAGGALLD